MLFHINYLPVSILAIVNMIFEKQNNNAVRLLSNNKKRLSLLPVNSLF